jgi:hypothetical protein
MQKRSKWLLSAVSGIVSLAGLADSTWATMSNGTGGGTWTTSDNTAWTGNTVPSTSANLTVAASDVVTASGVTYTSAGRHLMVYGELDLTNGSSLTGFDRIGYTVTTIGPATINLSNSVLTGNSVLDTVTVNVNSGSTFSLLATTNPLGSNTSLAVNVNTGGVFNTTANVGNRPVNLLGGKISITTTGTTGRAPSAWTKGTYVDNGARWSATPSSTLATALSSNSENVLKISESGKRVFKLAATNATFAPSNGNVAFNIYSAAANDNDSMTYALTDSSGNPISLTNTNYNFGFNNGSGVKFLLLGTNLTGASTDYVGSSYQLVLDQTGAIGTNLASANVPDALWTIGGQQYLAQFNITNLASSGTVSVASLTPTPEPTGAAALVGVAILATRRTSRRQRRRETEPK